MYKGYNIDLRNKESQSFLSVSQSEITKFENEMTELKKSVAGKMERDLEFPINPDGSINANKIANEWFPTTNTDIFISHSHNDERTAKRLGAWLKREFNLNTFIDSVVWGSANELLRKIDNKYCILSKKGDNTTYNYQTRNFTTSHVHMMLSSALIESINSTECLLFLNTPNTVTLTDVTSRKTNSPWIYNELKIASIVEKKRPLRYLTEYIEKNKEFVLESRDTSNVPDFSFLIDDELNTLENINATHLQKWQQRYVKNNGIHPLDVLYGGEK